MSLRLKPAVLGAALAFVASTLMIRAAADTAAAAAQTDPSAVAPAKADAAWAEIRALMNKGPGEDSKTWPKQRYMQWMEDREMALHNANLAFYENFPGDMRRWEAVFTLLQRSPRFITGWGPDAETKQWAAAVIDTDAAAQWKAQQRELDAVATAAIPTMSRELQQRFEARPIFAEIAGTYVKLERKQAVDWQGLRARVEAHVARFSDVPAIWGPVSRYLEMFERDHDAAATAKEWHALTVNPLVANAEMIKQRLAVIDRETAQPMEMAFTAADGRAVDLKKMRGKVILIDFWATWCGPCIAELPNVKRVYQAYHDKGFEVIGISLENAELKPADTPEQTAAKHTHARQKLLDFTRDNGIPWPQHYDGKYWEDEIARGRFNVHAVPATFLLDKTGKIAVIGVRVPQLEDEVKRLLAL
jgi:thiol-disulfide isomerase/thioredoxin